MTQFITISEMGDQFITIRAVYIFWIFIDLAIVLTPVPETGAKVRDVFGLARAVGR
jgi:hypothetical protein